MPTSGDPIDPKSLVGQTVLGVTASWFVNETGVHDLNHIWLETSGLGQVMCSGTSRGENVRLSLDEPYESYEMQELDAKVEVVEGTPASLATVIGEQITGVSPVFYGSERWEVGIILRTELESIAIANIGDDLAFETCAYEDRWEAVGFVDH